MKHFGIEKRHRGFSQGGKRTRDIRGISRSSGGPLGLKDGIQEAIITTKNTGSGWGGGGGRWQREGGNRQGPEEGLYLWRDKRRRSTKARSQGLPFIRCCYRYRSDRVQPYRRKGGDGKDMIKEA